MNNNAASSVISHEKHFFLILLFMCHLMQSSFGILPLNAVAKHKMTQYKLGERSHEWIIGPGSVRFILSLCHCLYFNFLLLF